MTPKREHVTRMARQYRRFVIFYVIVAAIFVIACFGDELLSLGWGFDWTDALAGGGFMVWGGILWLAGRAIFKLAGSQN